jgi:uncharacterized protein (TIGR03382 family)
VQHLAGDAVANIGDELTAYVDTGSLGAAVFVAIPYREPIELPLHGFSIVGDQVECGFGGPIPLETFTTMAVSEPSVCFAIAEELGLRSPYGADDGCNTGVGGSLSGGALGLLALLARRRRHA